MKMTSLRKKKQQQQQQQQGGDDEAGAEEGRDGAEGRVADGRGPKGDNAEESELQQQQYEGEDDAGGEGRGDDDEAGDDDDHDDADDDGNMSDELDQDVAMVRCGSRSHHLMVDPLAECMSSLHIHFTSHICL